MLKAYHIPNINDTKKTTMLYFYFLLTLFFLTSPFCPLSYFLDAMNILFLFHIFLESL